MRCFNDAIIKKIAFAPKVFFFLDYDGTLTPIVRKPEQARLTPVMKSVLRRSIQFKDIKVAVVSGRSLSDLQKVAGIIPGIIYVGNHGLEMAGDGFAWNHPSMGQVAKVMTEIWKKLHRDLPRVKGMLLENKTVGISLHYRLVSDSKVAELHRNFQKIVAPWVRIGVISTQEGKKVFEVRPRQRLWNKGRTVRWLLRKYQPRRFLPVFIGDDRTDEDAFKALQASGVTVKVTENPRMISFAKFYVHSPAEVLDLLEQVIKLRSSRVKRGAP